MTFGNNLAPSCFLARAWSDEDGAAYDRCMDICVPELEALNDPEVFPEDECDAACGQCLQEGAYACPYQ